MKTINDLGGTAAPAAPAGTPAGRRPRTRTALMFLLFAAFGGLALATEGEKYPSLGDAATEALVDAWKATIQRVAPSLCTGSARITGSESTREWNTGTPSVPGWEPLGGNRTDGAAQCEAHEGDDTDASGSDRYLYVKLVGTRASVFCKVVLEAEDGAESEWAVRYKGDEHLEYSNGPYRRAEEMTVSNPWAIGWSRRVVDFDAKNGEYDEEKTIDQEFAVRCELIDGSVVGDGAKFSRTVPATQSATTSIGLKLKAGTKIGSTSGEEYGAELGFEQSTSETYDTQFHELSDESASLLGVATATTTVSCPYANDWAVATYFDGKFSVHDHATLNGDKGSRQELLLTVVNYIASVRVEKCHGCGTTFPPIPPDPRTPRTPTDPVPLPPPGAITPGDASIPIPGAVTGDDPTTGVVPGGALPAPAGREPGWGGVPPARPGADPARGAASSSDD